MSTSDDKLSSHQENGIFLVLGYAMLSLGLAVITYYLIRIIVRYYNNQTRDVELGVELGGNEMSDNESDDDNASTDVVMNSDSENSDNEHQAVQLAPVLRENFVFMHGAEEDGCPICLGQFEWNIPLANTPCGHAFHLHCLSKWRPNTCPNCRRTLR